uniref:Uncharacterized protein n=1 Tax=Rhizophora mucronata TaxID=61149 RepID=A0A2P2NNX8_RHIMU
MHVSMGMLHPRKSDHYMTDFALASTKSLTP